MPFGDHDFLEPLHLLTAPSYVHLVGDLDLYFGELNFITPLNPSYPQCWLVKKHRFSIFMLLMCHENQAEKVSHFFFSKNIKNRKREHNWFKTHGYS